MIFPSLKIGVEEMVDIQYGENRFFIETDGEKLAEITYVKSGEQQITIDHTYVSEKLRGQKIGNALVEKVVELARQENLQVVPQCSFAVKEFKKNENYKDVLVK
jgi:predicted GNAT family acetyltransferase